MRKTTVLLSLLLILSLVGCNSTVSPQNQFGTSVSNDVNSEQELSFTDDESTVFSDESIESTDESDESVPEESELVFEGDPVPVLIGHTSQPSKRHNISELIEFDNSNYIRNIFDDTRTGETRTFNFYGVEFTMTYYANEYASRRSQMGIKYGNTVYVLCDETNGNVLSYWFPTKELDKYMNTKTELIDSDQAVELCYEYAKTLAPNEDLSKFKVNVSEIGGFFAIIFQYYEDECRTKEITFHLDEFGNPFSAEINTREPETYPELTLNDYLYGAIARIEEYYANKSDVVNVKDYKISTKANRTAYLWEHESVAYIYYVSYRVVYSDGTEEYTSNSFAYLYNR